jgi:hypothetical protein
MMAEDRPYELVVDGRPTGIVELPVEWILDDAPLMNPLGNRYSNPRDVLQVYKDEFDVAFEIIVPIDPAGIQSIATLR